ncbi:unnamed protein product [Caenorhabditis brenneri]
MFFALKVLIVLFALQSNTIAEEPLYQAFATVPMPNVTTMYNNVLSFYSSYTGNLISFHANNASMDYSSATWMNPCYREFYNYSANTFVVFWLQDAMVHCEAVISRGYKVAQKFPMANLMRVERTGQRCVII